jgi:hypothetical protein
MLLIYVLAIVWLLCLAPKPTLIALAIYFSFPYVISIPAMFTTPTVSTIIYESPTMLITDIDGVRHITNRQ